MYMFSWPSRPSGKSICVKKARLSFGQFLKKVLNIRNSLQTNQINNFSLPNLQCAVRWHQRYWRRVGEKCTQIKCVAVFRNELDRLFCRAEFAAANLMPRLRPPRAASLQQHTTRSDQSTQAHKMNALIGIKVLFSWPDEMAESYRKQYYLLFVPCDLTSFFCHDILVKHTYLQIIYYLQKTRGPS